MWVVTGPFDGQVPNEVGFQKSKLLKSGKSYFIGRKSACDLVVNHKKVSHDHGQLIVGEFGPDNVTNIDFTSTLRILNSKNKTMRILREGVSDGVIVNPGATETLKHDDKLDIVSGLPLTVQWNRICCFESPGSARTPIPIDGCASLGVHVVRTLHPDITHHLVPSYALTPAHMTSLLSAAQLVKPEWLSELLALSDLNPRESPRALEHAFALPPEGKFRPAFAAALPPALKTFKTWEPNEARLNMLKGYRFVFAGEKGLEIPAGYRDLVKRGGAEYEAFTVTAGVVRWRRTLVRAKALAEEKNEKVIPVADGDAMELTLGVDEWGEIASLARSFEVEFIPPENILQAIAAVDTFYVDSVRTSTSQGQGTLETPLPDLVPNTLSGEPSVAPLVLPPHAHRATSPSRATSEQPPSAVAPLSELPAPEPEIVEMPIRRRLPPRRANRTSPSPGPVGDAVIVGPSPTPGQPPVPPPQGDAAPASTQLPTPVSQTRKLPPRRRGIDPSSALLLSSSNPQTPQSQFSQLDKYKALFDASNPDHAPSSETQHGTPGTSTQGTRVGMLSVVPEEETESQLPTGTSRGTKRSRGDVDGGHNGDVVVADGATDAAPPSADTAEGVHRAKRRALDASSVSQLTPAVPASATTSQTRSTQMQRTGPGTGTTTAAAVVAGAGAKHTTNAPGSKSLVNADNKLDTDENFLKAVNSTKRGKKLEDDFDREFNQLRIAKPKNVDVPAAAAAAAAAAATAATGVPDPAVAPWDAIDDFGDVGIRGNFMVVVEIDVRRGGSARPAPPARTNDGHPEWAGRPNFKKFKTKNTAAIERKPTVELVVSEENDYGIGNAYWRSAASGSQSYSDVHDITAAHPPPLHNKSKASRTPTKSRGGRAPASLDEDEVEVVEELGLEEQDAFVTPLLKPPSTSTRSKTSAKGKAPAAAAKPPSKTKAKTTTTTTAAAAKTKTAAAKGKGKPSPRRTKKAPAATTRPRTTRGKKLALFLSDDESEEEEEEEEDEDEGGGSGEGEMDGIDEIDELDESAAVVAMELGAVEEEEDVRATVDDDERVLDAGMTSTLRSTAGTQSRREAMRAAKKRAAAAMGGADDDSDDAVFKGFGSKKRGRVR